MNPVSPNTLEIDLEKCAENAVTKAVGDHVTLHGQEHDFIKPFLHWVWINRNGPQIMEEYNKLPEKMKRYGRANYQRLDLATNQLKTAIDLFVGGHDRFSVIALASAADGILTQLVSNNGKETFTEILCGEDDDETMTISRMGSHVNKILSLNELKHMDKDDDDYILMDTEECAVATILKALENFVTLRGNKIDFVCTFLLWARLNLDPSRYNVNCEPNWRPTPTE